MNPDKQHKRRVHRDIACVGVTCVEAEPPQVLKGPDEYEQPVEDMGTYRNVVRPAIRVPIQPWGRSSSQTAQLDAPPQRHDQGGEAEIGTTTQILRDDGESLQPFRASQNVGLDRKVKSVTSQFLVVSPSERNWDALPEAPTLVIALITRV